MIFTAIAAVADNNVIGYKGDMPWGKMRADLKYFKQNTIGKWCILGRKSYNALGNKVLPGRKFIVVTRDKDFIAEDSIVVHDIKEALNHPALNGEEEVMILGGGEIYKLLLEYTHRVHFTKIHASFEGDTFFPELEKDIWILSSADHHEQDENNPHPYTFMVFDRK